jgi:hypothetical protein
MKYLVLPLVLGLGWLTATLARPAAATVAGRAVDLNGYLEGSRAAALHQASRLLTEEEFIRMSREKETIVLDVREFPTHHSCHVHGAENLAAAHADAGRLEALIPDKDTRILIYGYDNFSAPPDPGASPNILALTVLYRHGYRNVYELGTVIDPAATRLTLRSSW